MAKDEQNFQNKIVEKYQPNQPIPSHSVDTPVPPANSKDQLRCGFIIGISKDNELKFNLLGENPSIAEISGLLNIAQIYINNLMDTRLNTGMALIAKKLEELQKELERLGAYPEAENDI